MKFQGKMKVLAVFLLICCIAATAERSKRQAYGKPPGGYGGGGSGGYGGGAPQYGGAPPRQSGGPPPNSYQPQGGGSQYGGGSSYGGAPAGGQGGYGQQQGGYGQQQGGYGGQPQEEERPDPLAELLSGSKFSCSSKKDGYYADNSVSCQAFHYCVGGAKHSWMCPSGTVFHQVHLNCIQKSDDNNACSNADKFYFVNDYLNKPLDQKGPNNTVRYHQRYYPEGFILGDPLTPPKQQGQQQGAGGYGAPPNQAAQGSPYGAPPASAGQGSYGAPPGGASPSSFGGSPPSSFGGQGRYNPPSGGYSVPPARPPAPSGGFGAPPSSYGPPSGSSSSSGGGFQGQPQKPAGGASQYPKLPELPNIDFSKLIPKPQPQPQQQNQGYQGGPPPGGPRPGGPNPGQYGGGAPSYGGGAPSYGGQSGPSHGAPPRYGRY